MKEFILKLPVIYNRIQFSYPNLYKFLFLRLNLDSTIINNTNITNSIIKEFYYNYNKHSHTLTKSYIFKSNKKPWVQKGLGRSRAGSYASPIWRGGGILFGPLPGRIYLKINIKEILKLRQILIFNKRSNIIVFKLYTYNYCQYIYKHILLYLGISILDKILLLEFKNFNINAWNIIRYNYIIFLI